MPLDQELMRRIETASARLAEIGAAAAFWQEQTAEAARRMHGQALLDIQGGYGSTIGHVQQVLSGVEQAARWWSLAWKDAAWRSFEPAADVPVPHFTRVGELVETGTYGSLRLPALLPIIGGRNVLIKAAGPARDQANLAMQSLMLRLLATLPPGKLRFTMIDPVDRGRNMAGFMHLDDYVETLVGGQVWTEAGHIRQQLEDLTAHMDMVIQKYLRNQYPTMEAYNAEAGEVEEPYRLVVIANFPASFDEQTARRLLSIARSGPGCGVYLLATVDPEAKLPYNFGLAELEETASLITHEGGRFVWREPPFQGCGLTLDQLPPVEQFDRIVHSVGRSAQLGSKVEVPFRRIVLPESEWWQSDASEGLRISVGRVGARKVHQLELGRGTAQHALVVGKTGSGKSTMLHVLVLNLAMAYSPDQVMVYLIDFKKGVTFKDYAVHQLPHARVIAIQSEREFGLSVLQGLDAELQKRGDLFRASRCDELKDYREQTGQSMPRLLLLVDEFQEFFSEDDALAQQATMILDRLVRQGRAFGIHVLLGSQSLAGTSRIPRPTLDQMAVRIALQCSDADSRLILSDENNAARLLERPGEAIYNAANGLVEGNLRFQIVWLPDEEREAYLSRIQAHARKSGFVSARPPIVFEGNEPARVEENLDLRMLITGNEPLPSTAACAWLGDPVAIREQATAARFRQQSRASLLIVGQDEAAAAGMLAVGLVSLAAQHRRDGAQFYIVDLFSVDGPGAGLARRLAEILPQPVRVARRQRDIVPLMEELATAMEARLAQEADEASGPPLYLAIFGLHQARELRPDEGGAGYLRPSYGEPPPPPSPAQRLAAIIRDGPDVRIHTLAWCNTYANLERTLDRRGIAGFDMRIVTQVSADDSSHLLDSPAASRLGPNRAYLRDEEQGGRLEKFRPYAAPPAEWLTWVGERLRARQGEMEDG
jgi:energy-coupling factor transporter ATP-binding protein EcfA2